MHSFDSSQVPAQLAVAVDIGGTFTDIALHEPGTGRLTWTLRTSGVMVRRRWVDGAARATTAARARTSS